MTPNTNPMPDAETIDLVDLFFFLAKKWRGILISILIGAILGGGLFFVQRSRAGEVDMEAFQKSLERYEAQRDIISKRLEICQNAFDDLNAYFSKSVLMSVDSNRIPTAEVTLHIDLKSSDADTALGDSADELVAAYAAAANTAIDWDRLVRVDTPYTGELVTVEEKFLGNDVIVSVIYSDLETASALADGIAEQMIGWSESYQEIAPHTISVLSSDAAYLQNKELLTAQRSAHTILKEYKTNLTAVQNELSSLQEPSSSAGGGSKKLAAIICIGCIFCYGAFLVAAYLFSGTVHTEADVADAYGISLIGRFYPGEKKSLLDRLLNKWKYGHVSEPDEAAYLRIANNIRNLNKGSKLLLTGGTDASSLNVLAEKLSALLPEIVFEAGTNVVRDAGTLIKMNQADAIVLVEQAGASRRTAVRQEILSIAGISKPILGVVFLSEGKQLS